MFLPLFCFLFFSFFASSPAGGQVLNKNLSDSLGDFLRARGGNFEKSVGTKSLIADLAALAGKTGHTGRDHVRRVFERLASGNQHQSGSGEVWPLWQGGLFFLLPNLSTSTDKL